MNDLVSQTEFLNLIRVVFLSEGQRSLDGAAQPNDGLRALHEDNMADR